MKGLYTGFKAYITNDTTIDIDIYIYIHIYVDIYIDNNVYINIDIDVITRRRKKDIAEVLSNSYKARGGRNSGVYIIRQSAGRK